MDIAIPCRCVVPTTNEALFRPGILFESEDETRLGSLSLTESSRYRSFWRHLGFVFDQTRYDLVLEVGTAPIWILQARARSWSAVPENRVLTAANEPAGAVEIKCSAIRVPTRKDRATFRDERGSEIGYVELRSGFSVSVRFVDQLRGWDYEMDSFIRSKQTDVIDSRLLLAWCFYSQFYSRGTD